MSDQLYRQQIIENYKNPMNTGVLDVFDIKEKVFNTSCGDEVEVYLKLDGNIVKNISFEGRGCAISIASSSLVTEHVKNMKIEEILKLDESFIEEILGTKLVGTRIKCGVLGLSAIQQAIASIKKP